MTIRPAILAALALALVGSVGDLSAQGPTVVSRLSIRQGGVILGTLEIPAGVTFGMVSRITGETIPVTMQRSADGTPTFTQGAAVVNGEYQLTLSSGTVSSDITIQTRNNTTLVVEPR